MTDLFHLRSRYLSQPYEVSIETLALCNARCTFCPYPTLARKGEVLDIDVIQRLIGEMVDWEEPFFVSPFKVNEPLLDVRLESICREIVARVPQAKLRIFTNGQPLSHRHMQWIADLAPGRVEHLWVSLNSTDPQEYGELMGCTYSMVQRRLDELHDAKLGGSFPHPVVLSRVMQGSGRDPERWPLDSKFIGDCEERWPSFTPFLIKRDGWLGYVDPSDPKIPQRGCERWFELSITAEGDAALCCMDGTGEHKLGNIKEQSLLEVYNQTALRNRREFAVTRAGIEPCARCTY